MRRLAAVLMLACAGVAGAAGVAAPSIVDGLADDQVVVMWFKLRIAASGDTEAARLAHLQWQGFGEAAARALIAQLDSGEAELRRVGAELRGRICDDADGMRARGRDALATLVESNQREQNATYRRLITATRAALADRDLELFDRVIVHDPRGFTGGSANLAEQVRRGDISVDDVIERTCGAAPAGENLRIRSSTAT